MVIEEKFVSSADIPPLQAVGWEGIFGFIGICLVMIPLNFIPSGPPFADNSRGTLEASIDAFIQISNSGRLFMSIIGNYYLLIKRINVYILKDRMNNNT